MFAFPCASPQRCTLVSSARAPPTSLSLTGRARSVSAKWRERETSARFAFYVLTWRLSFCRLECSECCSSANCWLHVRKLLLPPCCMINLWHDSSLSAATSIGCRLRSNTLWSHLHAFKSVPVFCWLPG